MSSASEPLIRVRDLTIGWGPELVLQENASFDVERGDIFVILGGSGCGKSTMLRHLVGLNRPMSGTVFVEGVGEPRLRVGRPAFGVMFQGGALFGSMTLAENVALPLETWTDLPPEAVEVVVRSRLKLVGLDGFEHHFPAEISGGMKKRAAIARAMALEPELLFLDEPSAGLDPISAVELDELILTLNRGLGLTVVLVTHELESIFKIAKRCIFLDKDSRSIIARGDPRELRDTSEDPRVRDFFNRNPTRQSA
jgi:phospholipid/cholesterol/gamma-HCH transport system ATP-binding protein